VYISKNKFLGNLKIKYLFQCTDSLVCQSPSPRSPKLPGGGGEKWRGDLRSPNESAIGLVDISMSALLANLQSPSAFVSQSGLVSAPMRNALLMSGSPFLALAFFSSWPFACMPDARLFIVDG